MAHSSATEVRALGFNTDFAPALDLRVRSVEECADLADGLRRSESDDRLCARVPARTARCDVLGCGKHFPGLGEANLDSHHDLPSIDKPWKTTVEGGPGSLSRAAPRVAVRDGGACRLSGGHGRPHSGVAVEEVDDRHPAQEDRLSRADHLRRPRHGRRAGGSVDRRGRGRNAARRGRHVPGLPERRERVAGLRGGVQASRKRQEICAPRGGEIRGAFLLAKKRSRALEARMAPAPTQKTVDKLRREIWEFSEEVRACALASR